MNLSQMEQAQSNNVRPVIAGAMTLFAPYKEMQIAPSLWMQILRLLFSIVQPASVKSAEISREFYDSERERVGLPHHPIPLADLTFERFVSDMEPVSKMIRAPTTSDGQVHQAALRVARSVENSGRWTIMKAVEYPEPEDYEEDDEEEIDPLEVSEISLRDLRKERQRALGPNTVKGWARIATGRETCGWCLMLVSRGPVYRSAGTAGSRLSDRSALQVTGSREFDPQESMNEWHTGCDCKIVPVFNLDNWDGRQRYLAAEEMWRRETRGYSGKDAINAFRRAAEAGKYLEYMTTDKRAA